ncbi:hypothetical protein Hypma_007626 [Hypsizygus marmoreus]|uniref:Uncharacterized protein n=1 Tax=Hypsizygus marmoreus TaxID=39966 RepID=A0A369JS57_HYPMA|nr:hypothetical protein Hypma_007626 [Hypsizygus marmoreus]
MRFPCCWTVLITCACFATVSNAVPIIEASNGTQSLNLNDFPNNPFEGITIQFQSESFRRSIIEKNGALEDRGMGGVVDAAIDVIKTVVNVVKNAINRDKKARGEFTKHLVNQGRASKPEFNWIACHTKHRTQWKGNKGTDWGHSHEEFDVKLGGTVGYEVYYAREGEFWNLGDGGYLNWAYAGNYKADTKKHIIFSKP